MHGCGGATALLVLPVLAVVLGREGGGTHAVNCKRSIRGRRSKQVAR